MLWNPILQRHVAQGAPGAYDPDKTQNYEVGVKGAFFDQKFSVDASLYYIDWKDILIQLDNSQGFSYSTNGGRAKSEGVEFSAEARPFCPKTRTA